jgi:hypothetical protein
MRTRQTLILITFVGTLLVFGSDVLSWLRDAYWAVKDTEPSSKHATFFGRWLGTSGATIDIRGDGRADFHDGKSQLRSAHLKIEEHRLIMSFPGFQKALTINDPPRLGHDGLWRMRLDGELFVRHSQDVMVGIETIRPLVKA